MLENKYPDWAQSNGTGADEHSNDKPWTKMGFKNGLPPVSKWGRPIIQWEKSGMTMEPEC